MVLLLARVVLLAERRALELEQLRILEAPGAATRREVRAAPAVVAQQGRMETVLTVGKAPKSQTFSREAAEAVPTVAQRAATVQLQRVVLAEMEGAARGAAQAAQLVVTMEATQLRVLEEAAAEVMVGYPTPTARVARAHRIQYGLQL